MLIEFQRCVCLSWVFYSSAQCDSSRTELCRLYEGNLSALKIIIIIIIKRLKTNGDALLSSAPRADNKPLTAQTFLIIKHQEITLNSTLCH